MRTWRVDGIKYSENMPITVLDIACAVACEHPRFSRPVQTRTEHSEQSEAGGRPSTAIRQEASGKIKLPRRRQIFSRMGLVPKGSRGVFALGVTAGLRRYGFYATKAKESGSRQGQSHLCCSRVSAVELAGGWA